MTTRNLIASAGIALIYNRETGTRDGWIHIVPKGELANTDAGVVQVLDDKSLEAIVANIKSDQQRLGSRWPGVYGGEEHFIYNSDKSSEAFMWAKDFEIREDGIWGKGDVTDVGEPAIKNKRFKFTSFVTDPTVAGSTEKLDGNRVRILKIDTFGFTNFANGRHLLTPISNRNTLQQSAADSPTGELVDKNKKSMKSIATKLGLSPDASEEAILGEVIKIMNRAESAEAKIKPLTDENALLKNRVETLDSEQIDADLDVHGIKEESSRAKIKPVLLPMKNRAERVDFIKLFGKPEATQQAQQKPLTNRSAASQPNAARQQQEPTAADNARLGVLIKNRATEIEKTQKCTLAQAYLQADAEIKQEQGVK